MKKTIRKIAIVLVYLVLWQIISIIINNKIYFVGPYEVVLELGRLVVKGAFWKTVMCSFVRIIAGFIIAFFVAYLCALVSYRYKLMQEILSPLVSFFKTVPVASVVVILLIWSGAKWLTLYITFMVVFPNIYLSMLEGLESTDEDMLEMAECYKMSFLKRMKYIHKPYYMPQLYSSTKVSVGMSFKSGVAAEIIGLPAFSIGERIYSEKIYLNTEGVFAWTCVLIIVSVITEKLILRILEFNNYSSYKVKLIDGLSLEKRLESRGQYELTDVVLDHARGRYGDHVVIEDFSYTFCKNKIYCIMGPSGCGKTTLLNMIYSLYPDSKRMYQEYRLVEHLGAGANIIITDPVHTTNELIWYMTKAGLADSYLDPVETYSGGMKRRVALLRALLSDSTALLLDEPFSGLDDESKRIMQALIFELQKGRTIIITTHDEEDAKMLGASVIKL